MQVTDAELAQELAWYAIGRVRDHLNLNGAEIDADCEICHMEELIADIRKDFEL